MPSFHDSSPISHSRHPGTLSISVDMKAIGKKFVRDREEGLQMAIAAAIGAGVAAVVDLLVI